jgi:DNA-binding response OmpR family regulator
VKEEPCGRGKVGGDRGAAVSESLPLTGRTILIVEDAYLIALEAQRIVEEGGAERVLLANTVDGVRALLAAEPNIDICVLDLRLGEEDASPLIAEMAERGVLVLVATGFDSVSPDVDVPLLKKPYEEAEFIEAIRAVLRDKD